MIIDGKKLANKIKEDIKQKVSRMSFCPGLAVVLVGNDPASKIYVGAKEKACKEVGFYSKKIVLSATVSQKTLLKEIDQLNNDSKIHGILVQLPLPQGLDEKEVIQSIKPEKDVDCFHPINVGKLSLIKRIDDLNNFLAPCTAKGVVRLIEYANSLRSTASKFSSSRKTLEKTQLANKVEGEMLSTKKENFEQSPREFLKGGKAVVIGRSNLVGKPLALMLLAKDATVTICHSKTRDLKKETKQADILVAAVGRAGMITADMVKKGAIVIDVGINRTKKGLVGDVDFEEVKNVADFITPVPGGVGPMTIACLLENTLLSSQKSK